MSTYREDLIHSKAVRKGIIDQREVGTRNKRTRDWLIVILTSQNFWLDGERDTYPTLMSVWGEYRSDQEARVALEKSVISYRSYFRTAYLCHRSIYELYKPYYRKEKVMSK